MKKNDGVFPYEYSLNFPTISKDKFPVVIFVHGWLGDSLNSTRVDLQSEKLIEKGFAICRLNLPGHGKCQGSKEFFTINQGKQAILATVQMLRSHSFIDSDQVSLIAASIGGACSICAASETKYLKAMVLLSPRSSFSDTKRGFYSFKQKDNDTRKWVKLTNHSMRRSGLRIDFLNKAAQTHIPVLIQHGDADPYIPLEQSQKLLKALASRKKKLIVRKGEGHLFKGNHFDDSIQTSVDWISQN